MSEDTMADRNRACPWTEGEPCAADDDHPERRKHLSVRLTAIEEALEKRNTGNSAQWVGVIVAFIGLLIGAWGVTQRLESRITRLETSIEYMRTELQAVGNQLRVEARRETGKL